jgi:hypothetical protein
LIDLGIFVEIGVSLVAIHAKMQRNSKKAASGSAAASAGAIAGALAASNAAYAATCNMYGILPHNFTPSPSNSAVSESPAPGGQALTSSQGGGNSAHSSPRVSPVPPAFVATSLVSITPNSGLKGVKSSLTQSKTKLMLIENHTIQCWCINFYLCILY